MQDSNMEGSIPKSTHLAASLSALVTMLLLSSYQLRFVEKHRHVGFVGLGSALVGAATQVAGARNSEVWQAADTSGETDQPLVVGDKTYHPSFGTYPAGCKWREVTTEGQKGSEYQFWDATSNIWKNKRPKECHPTGVPAPGPAGWSFRNGSPRTEVSCSEAACIFHNLFYNNGRWYAVVDGPQHIPHWRLSRNQEIITIHVDSAQEFINSVIWSIIPGDTILFDFIFFTHPTAIGHWWEMVGPLFSILKREAANFKRPCDQFILLHLKRSHVLEWVRAMISVTLGVDVSADLPPIYMQEETDSAFSQISQQLEGFRRDTWYIFEKVMLTKDLYTGGGRTFLSTEVAQEFRGLIYQQYGLPAPTHRPEIPKVITYQRKRVNRRILNEDEFVEMLKEFGEVQVVEYNSSSSLYQQLLQMKETGIFISVHTSNLANAPLLQPGSAVFEIIARNWHWNGLDTSFRDQTITMGDIHHYAWRAQKLNQTVYLDKRDFVKVAHWPPEECGTEECVEAHTNVDVYVDVASFRNLLKVRVPLIYRGVSVQKAALPWPPAVDKPEHYNVTWPGGVHPLHDEL